MARPQGSTADVTGPRVRDAAARLFAQHGYAAVSMRQIAAEVGIGAGALYHYTPDKQTLLFEGMRAHLEEVIASWAGEDPGGDAVQRLDAWARFHIRFHLARPDATFIAYMELRNLDPENYAEIERMRREYEAVSKGILEQGLRGGQMNVADVHVTSMALIAMLTGVNTWYRETGRLTPAQIEDSYAAMALTLAGVV